MPADRITLDQIVMRKGASPPVHPPLLTLVGWWAFRMLLAFVGVSYLVLALFAWRTYPASRDSVDVGAVNMAAQVPQPAAPELEDTVRLREARAEWLAEVKELGQMFILTPVLPLLGAVLGYLFGREQRAASSEE